MSVKKLGVGSEVVGDPVNLEKALEPVSHPFDASE